MRYVVMKYFGHFAQSWVIEADNEEEAWDNAEQGKMLSLNVYDKKFNTPGHVTSYADIRKTEPVSDNQYYTWMEESVEAGMQLPPHYQEKLDNWRKEKSNK